ncbi:amidase [Burkholderia multivorans]|uniref:amidase n=1 Tax=Burkholderia multivorans TaxID=87883 RepID=UPI001C257979|nr:amidase [Burkholderia multivorans]MBU9597076.1 amidase [Burkholderia multivorans]MDN7997022.1 amidase [Burkholderia multivorans]WVN01573.1 amidase [Burkholderia multivorans]
MNLSEYADYDAMGLAELVRSRQVSPRELAQTGLSAIAALNPTLNAVIEVYEDAVERSPAPDTLSTGPFPGVPFLLKDIGSHDNGVTFELGSRLARGMKAPPVASELIERFRASGVTILGRTNIPELGSSCTTEPVLYGPTRNPWHLERTPGGSSGGAAAAVASGMVPIAHANDAGGSIRWPAACCGVFGLKPSRNLNPVGPDAALALNGFAAEHIVSRSVRDTAAMLDVTAGPDVGAWCYTPRFEGSYLAALKQPVGRLRIGLNVTPVFPPTTLDPAVVTAVRASAALCESLGHHVEEVTFDFDHETLFEAFGVIWSTSLRFGIETIAALTGRTPGSDTLEPHVLAAFRGTEHTGSSRVMWALEQMNIASRAYGRYFGKYDVMLTPAGSQPPFPLGQIGAIPTDDFMAWFRNMCAHCPFLSTANIAGIPGMSVPLQWTDDALPVGSHFLAASGRELLLLQLAAQLEEAQPWIGRLPPHHVSRLG